MCKNIALQSLQIFYIIVLRAEIVITFGSKMVTISTQYRNISPSNFGILLILKGCFREFRFFCQDLIRSKISLSIMGIGYSWTLKKIREVPTSVKFVYHFNRIEP